MDSQENRQKRNRKIPLPHGAASCDSKSASSAETDSRSTPYEFFTGDCLVVADCTLAALAVDDRDWLAAAAAVSAGSIDGQRLNVHIIVASITTGIMS